MGGAVVSDHDDRDDYPTCPGYPDRCDVCRSTETLMAPEPGCFAYVEDEER